ncbi:hypothetical protein [Streptomyces albogriseolus]|uniref:hypothetical protein n=1 Tax=Streptomyces albogriseolus TaxID=1887 RepID=UPI00345F7BF6
MMTTPWPPRRTARRPLAPRVAAPREPVDPVRIARRVVRRRAKGMGAGAVAAALEDARFDARQDSRHEDLADDVRGRAELAEWERIDQLLAAAPPGTVYAPDADPHVQEELAAEAAAAAAREAELREAARIAARADELQALRELGTLEQTEPREGDEAARDELTRRAGVYVQGDVDAWLARALAAHLGHYTDPAARAAAAGLLPAPVLAHAALLTELACLAPNAGADQLVFAARLATADPEAAGSLAAFLARAPALPVKSAVAATDCTPTARCSPLHPSRSALCSGVAQPAAAPGVKGARRPLHATEECSAVIARPGRRKGAARAAGLARAVAAEGSSAVRLCELVAA